MNDPKPMGSVAELLLNYVSTTHEHDVNFSIAVTMLNHYRWAPCPLPRLQSSAMCPTHPSHGFAATWALTISRNFTTTWEIPST